MANRHHLVVQGQSSGAAWPLRPACLGGWQSAHSQHGQLLYHYACVYLSTSAPLTAQNDLKVYGSPALDAVWDCATGKKPASAAADPLAGVLAELRNADVPPRLQVAGGGGKVARGKKK